MTTAAFLGLGVMGYPMAGFLAASGLDVRVFNRTGARAEQWVTEKSGSGACSAHSTPAEAAQDADVVFACVGNDDDVRAITTGENGAFSTMKKGDC